MDRATSCKLIPEIFSMRITSCSLSDNSATKRQRSTFGMPAVDPLARAEPIYPCVSRDREDPGKQRSPRTVGVMQGSSGFAAHNCYFALSAKKLLGLLIRGRPDALLPTPCLITFSCALSYIRERASFLNYGPIA